MNRPWMPLYIADYRADTAHLSPAQHGAYLLLIMHYWMTGALPVDDLPLSRIACMTPAEWHRNRSTVAAFFTPEWKHKRIDKELAKLSDISSKRSAAAKQRHCNGHAIAEQMDMQNGLYARVASQPHPQERNSEAKASAADAAPDDPRTKLFRSGLANLQQISGRTEDSCRSLLGKWLKGTKDDPIEILAAIDDAVRNRVANPVPWIQRRLEKPPEPSIHVVPDTWIAMDTPEWSAWTKYRGGKPFPLDKRGGWTAPSQWPPEDGATGRPNRQSNETEEG